MLIKPPISLLAGLSVGVVFSLLNLPSLAEDTPQTVHSNSLLLSQSAHSLLPNSINPAQQRSYKRLQSHYGPCYTVIADDSFQYQLDTSNTSNTSPSDYSLPNPVGISFYENHSEECGGDPHTFPRVASYLIDRYGRIFKQNEVDGGVDLQFKFNETPTLISDLANFQHPSKRVFEKYGVIITQIEKRAENSFVIFHVANTPLLSGTIDSDTEQSRQQFFAQLLTSNGGWDLMLRCEDGQTYYLEGTKRKIIDPVSD